MKRPLFLAGTIASLTICFIFAFSNLIAFISVQEYAIFLSDTYICLLLFSAVVPFIAALFNIDCISSWKLPKEKFIKKKGIHLATIILNFVAIEMIFSFLFWNSMPDEDIVVTILGCLPLIAGTVLMLVDFCREGSKKEKGEQETENNAAKVVKEENEVDLQKEVELGKDMKVDLQEETDFEKEIGFNLQKEIELEFNEPNEKPLKDKKKKVEAEKKEEPKQENKVETKEVAKGRDSLLVLESKLIKLNKMKSQGLIDEEEYIELKKSYIKEEIKNK